jgi:hypothetical protein
MGYQPNMLAAVPDIEELIPLPASSAEAVPPLTPHEELAMRARTIKLLSDMTGQVIAPSGDHLSAAVGLAKQMIEDPTYRPTFAQYPDETVATLAGLVSQFNKQIVDDLSDLKLYVVNKLVYEIETTRDTKARITALSRLGEIDGIDAFKKRSEMTVNIRPIEEVEKELLSVLSNIEYRVLPAPAPDPAPREVESDPVLPAPRDPAPREVEEE